MARVCPPKGKRRDAAEYRRLREAAYDEEVRLFPLLECASFRDFVTLFIAEGYKRSRNTVSIANSDPAVILAVLPWMRRLSRNPVRFSVQYHRDQNLRRLQEFWASQVEVSPEEIRLQRKSNSSELASRTWRCEHGVLTVAANDTYFRSKLQAWVDWVRDGWLDSGPNGA